MTPVAEGDSDEKPDALLQGDASREPEATPLPPPLPLAQGLALFVRAAAVRDSIPVMVDWNCPPALSLGALLMLPPPAELVESLLSEAETLAQLVVLPAPLKVAEYETNVASPV